MHKDPISGRNSGQSFPGGKLPKLDDETANLLKDLELLRSGGLGISDPVRAMVVLDRVGQLRKEASWALFHLKEILDNIEMPSPLRGAALHSAVKIDPTNEELIDLTWKSMTQINKPYLKAHALLAAHELYPGATFARPIETLYQLGRTILSPVLCAILLRDNLKERGIFPPSCTPEQLSQNYPAGFEARGYHDLMRIIKDNSVPPEHTSKALLELGRRFGMARETKLTCLSIVESSRSADLPVKAHAITALGMINRNARLPESIKSPDIAARMMLSPKVLQTAVKASFDQYLR